MSGLAVCWNLDGTPLSATTLPAMTAAVPHRGPDGVGHWVSGAVGLGHSLLTTTPESIGERQPLVAGDLALAFDGRLDNRDELLGLLRPDPLLDGPVATDATLVLLAYRRWGTSVAGRLLGDFAFALWDGSRRRMVCARDPFGLKPLYYFHDARRFVAGSEPRQLLASGVVRAEPNLGMVAEYLACAVTHPRETLFAQVWRIPAAHTLVVDGAVARLTRHWSPGCTPVRHRTDEDYAQAFLAVVREAVLCRLRSSARVGSELSGGVDSTTIVGLVRDLQQRGRWNSGPLETFSLVCPGLPCDETAFVEQAVAFFGGPSTRLGPGDPLAPDLDPLPEFPWYPNGTAFNPLARAASVKGIRVMLTGHGGDEWFTGSRFDLADALGSLRLGRVWRQLRGMRALNAEGTMSLPARPFYRYGLVPLAPDWLRRAARGYRRWRPRPAGDPHPPHPWISPRLKSGVSLADRLRAGVPPPNLPTHALRDTARYMVSGLLTCEFEMTEHLNARFQIEQRHPLYDVRVTDWALGLPEAQRWTGTETKAVLRRAMRDRIPETIRTRRTKAEFSVFLAQALRQVYGDGPFRVPSLTSMGWVDEGELARMYTRLSALCDAREEGYPSLAWPLWTVHAVEQWYRSIS